MDRLLLIISTLWFFLAMVRTTIAIKARTYRSAGFNFFSIALGFVFQTAFLSVRGHALGRCPLTNLFEVFIFLAWSVSLIYLLIGPAYRLSLMGAFTAPLVFGLQTFALLAPIDRPHLMSQASEIEVDFAAVMQELSAAAAAAPIRDLPAATSSSEMGISALISAVHSLGQRVETLEESVMEAYRGTPKINPRGAVSGAKRVYRGGSWKSRFHSLRATTRGGNVLSYSCNDLGFRIVCECE